METKHTPGQWKVSRDGHLVQTVDESNKRGGLVICDVFGMCADNREANARLIAAEPDLLAALIELLDQAGEVYPHFESERGQANIAQARAAISRATGQEVRP